MYKTLLFSLCICIALVSNGQTPLIVSYDEALDIALNQNVDIQMRTNELRVQQAQHQEAKMRFLPNLNLNLSTMRQIGQQFQAIEDRIVVTNIATDFVSSNISANLDLYTGMSRKNNYQATKYRLIQQNETIKQTRLNIILDVTRQYLQVLLDKELIKIARENLENQRKQLRQIEQYVQSGIRARPDLMSQKAELARLELEVVNAEIQTDNDLQLLSGTLQLDAGYTLDIKEIQGLELRSSGFETFTLSELISIAKNQRPDIKSQQAAVNASELETSIAKSFYLPRLTAFYSLGTFFTTLDERTFGTQFLNVYPTHSVGVRLQVPIFDNFQTKTNVVRAEIQAKNEELNSIALERQIFQEVQSAHLQYKAALKREESTASQLKAAEDNFVTQEERFRLGLNSIVEYAEANRLLVQAKSDSTQALYSKIFSEMILQYTLGSL